MCHPNIDLKTMNLLVKILGEYLDFIHLVIGQSGKIFHTLKFHHTKTYTCSGV